MITVVCTEWHDFLGRGAEYVAKLASMVARHLSVPHRFICVTDRWERHPGIECQDLGPVSQEESKGCWAKLRIFQPGRFDGRCVYLDVDSVIVGPLEPLAAHKGAVYLEDWGWAKHCLAGGMLVWDAGEHEELCYHTAEIRRRFNDQEWMTVVGGWSRLPPLLCRSYRYHCKAGPPAGACLVAFHGRPKPHEFTEGWVKEGWR